MATKDRRHQGKGPHSAKTETFKLKLGTDGLPEVTSDSGSNWIPITAAVKKYCNITYSTLTTIFQDPLLAKEPAYEILVEPDAGAYEVRILAINDILVITPATDDAPAVTGANPGATSRRNLITAEYNSKLTSYQKDKKKATEERKAMYGH